MFRIGLAALLVIPMITTVTAGDEFCPLGSNCDLDPGEEIEDIMVREWGVEEGLAQWPPIMGCADVNGNSIPCQLSITGFGYQKEICYEHEGQWFCPAGFEARAETSGWPGLVRLSCTSPGGTSSEVGLYASTCDFPSWTYDVILQDRHLQTHHCSLVRVEAQLVHSSAEPIVRTKPICVTVARAAPE